MSELSDIWPLYTCNYQWVNYLICDHNIPVTTNELTTNKVTIWYLAKYIPVTTNELTILDLTIIYL